MTVLKPVLDRGTDQTENSLRMIEEYFPIFENRVKMRLQQGAVEYGDKSFHKPLLSLVDEIQQEIEDINGWSFIPWVRLEKLKQKLTQLDAEPEARNA